MMAALYISGRVPAVTPLTSRNHSAAFANQGFQVSTVTGSTRSTGKYKPISRLAMLALTAACLLAERAPRTRKSLHFFLGQVHLGHDLAARRAGTNPERGLDTVWEKPQFPLLCSFGLSDGLARPRPIEFLDSKIVRYALRYGNSGIAPFSGGSKVLRATAASNFFFCRPRAQLTWHYNLSLRIEEFALDDCLHQAF